MVKIKNIPKEMKELNNWVVWREETREDGKKTKVPYNAKTLKGAMSNNPKTWSSLAEAYTCLINEPDLSGLGFMLNGSGIVCVDLDNKDGAMSDQEFKDLFHNVLLEIPSFTEISFSGKGYHIFAKGKLPQGRRKSKHVEMYDDTRYIAITGDIFGDYDSITEQQDGINTVHERYLGTSGIEKPAEEVLREIPDSKSITVNEVLKMAKNDEAFMQLYRGEWEELNFPSQSEADSSFAARLAYYTNYNIASMDEVFRSSGLYREKYERKQSGSTYGLLLLENAVAWVYNKQAEEKNTELISYDVKKKAKQKNSDTGIDGEVVEEKDKSVVTKSRYTDTSNAMEFLREHGDNIRYNYDNKAWFIWNGKFWEWDRKNKIRQFADKTADNLLINAKQTMDDVGFRNALRVLNSSGKNNMIQEAMHQDKIGILNKELDNNILQINTLDGVYDLSRGEMLAHDPKLYQSQITGAGVSFKKPKVWIKFLNEIFKGDETIINFMQKAIGYNLTGSIKEQKIFVLYGSGNNGKSVFMDTIQKMLGSYATTASTEVLMEKRGGGSVETTLARIRGARFVTASETSAGDHLNEGLIKEITGGEKVIGRFLYGNEFEYYPEYKLWIATNNKPRIKGTDFGIWRRIVVVPFLLQLTEKEADKNLPEKLEAELDQIMGWAIEGYNKYLEEGLFLPEVLEIEKEIYKSENDYISNFIFERIDKKEGFKIGASVVYNEFNRWCKEVNIKTISMVRFGREFSRHFEKTREGTGIMYLNCMVKPRTQEYTLREFRKKKEQ